MKLRKIMAYLCAFVMLFTLCTAYAEQGAERVVYYQGGVVQRGIPRGTADSDLLQMAYAHTDMAYIIQGETYVWDLNVTGGVPPYTVEAWICYQELSQDPFEEGWSVPAVYYPENMQVSHTFNTYGRYFWEFHVEDAAGQTLTIQTRIYETYSDADEEDPTTVVGKVNSLIDELITPGMSAYKRALVLHDWLIYNANYDYTFTYYDAEGVLLRGTGVCDSYARAYLMLCTAAGIECVIVGGTAGSGDVSGWGAHAWNLIKLDGNWYHVDCTWDDPGTGGSECHTYFCVDDDFMEKDHRWNRPDDPFDPYSMMVPEAEGGEYEPASAEAEYHFTFTTWAEFSQGVDALVAAGERPPYVYGLYTGTDTTGNMWSSMGSWAGEESQALYDEGLANGMSYGYRGSVFYLKPNWFEPTGHLTFGGQSLWMTVGETTAVTAGECYSLNNVYTCESSDPAVVTASVAYDETAGAAVVTLTALTGGTAEVTVSAHDGRGDTLQVTVLPPYEADLGMTLTETAAGVRVAWEYLPGATDYAVICVAEGVETTLATTTGAGVVLTIEQLPCTREQTVRVDALRKVNGVLKLTTPGEGATYGYKPVAAETLAPVITETAEGVSLAWNAAPGATEYQLWRSAEGQEDALLTTVSSPSASLTAAQLPAGTEQQVYVVARRMVGGTVYAAWTGSPVTYGSSVPQLPAYALTLQETAAGVDVAWDAVTYADSYDVIRVLDGVETVLATLTAPGCSLTPAQLPPVPEGVQQLYVRAACTTDEGVTFTHNSAAATYGYSVPDSFRATVTASEGGATVAWDAVEGATSYRVYRSIDGVTTIPGMTEQTSLFLSEDVLPSDVVQTVYVEAVRTVEGRDVFCFAGALVRYGEWYVAPADFDLQMEETAVGLSFMWSAIPHMQRYDVYCRTEGGEPVLVKADAEPYGVTLSVHDFDPFAGLQFYVTCSRTDSDGSTYTFSSEKVAWGYAQPAGFAVRWEETAEGLLLSWDEVDFADNYTVYTIDGGVETYLDETEETSLLLSDSQAPADEKHTFMARAWRIVGGATYFTCDAEPVSYGFDVPDSFTITVQQLPDAVTVAWPAVDGATQYQIFRRVNGETALLVETDATSATLSLAQLPPYGAQEVLVRAQRVVAGRTCFEVFSEAAAVGGTGFQYESELPAGLTEVAEEAFLNDGSLKTLRMNSGLKTIGPRAFSGCAKLTVVSIPASVEQIGEDAFSGTALVFAEVAEGSYADTWFRTNMPAVQLVYE